jgi:hypothetical protein
MILTLTQGPSPVVIFCDVSNIRNGLMRTGKRGKSIGKSKLPNRLQRIPHFDRKEMRERVNRLLRETQHERDLIKGEHQSRAYTS